MGHNLRHVGAQAPTGHVRDSSEQKRTQQGEPDQQIQALTGETAKGQEVYYATTMQCVERALNWLNRYYKEPSEILPQFSLCHIFHAHTEQCSTRGKLIKHSNFLLPKEKSGFDQFSVSISLNQELSEGKLG
ncbi:hypothetical protein [Pectobacterium odoriferum]|uniref:hypothetical protein n=1 Tax=Pectobacterium odoriferum TaxID=78398 RepID=UPI0011AF97FD|nr:hypothetical protein [Pectobacterium odoriferum]